MAELQSLRFAVELMSLGFMVELLFLASEIELLSFWQLTLLGLLLGLGLGDVGERAPSLFDEGFS